MSKSYEAIATAVPTPLVEVVAPATLVEGYTFEALYQGKTFQVVVVRSMPFVFFVPYKVKLLF